MIADARRGVIPMRARAAFLAAVAAMTVSVVLAQDTPQRGRNSGGGSGLPTVETVPVVLSDAGSYRVSAVLQPARVVRLRAAADGMIREIAVEAGTRVKQAQLVARMDPSEAQAHFRLAEAELEEALAAAKLEGEPARAAAAKARVEAGKARLEIARGGLAATNMSAPFEGEVLEVLVTPGQFVLKGETIATVADVSSMRVVVPVDRGSVKAGQTITLDVEGQSIEGKVVAVLPLPESFAVLRGLAASFAGAAVSVPNAEGSLAPGFRVESPFLPDSPLATVEDRAIKRYANGTASVQVLRNERVTTLPTRVLGRVGSDRTQVSAAFQVADALILGSSVPLVDGTIVRFDGNVPDSGPASFNPNVSPIGAAGPSTKPAESKGTTKSDTKTAPGRNTAVPF